MHALHYYKACLQDIDTLWPLISLKTETQLSSEAACYSYYYTRCIEPELLLHFACLSSEGCGENTWTRAKISTFFA